MNVLLSGLAVGALAFAALAPLVALSIRLTNSPALRHAIVAAALLAGTLIPLLPRWGTGWIALGRVPSASVTPITAGAESRDRVEPASASEPGPMTIPEHASVTPSAPPSERNVPVTTEIMPSPAAAPPDVSRVAWLTTLPWGSLVLGLQAAGSLLMAIRLGRSMTQLAGWRRVAEPFPEDEERLVRRCALVAGVNRRFDLGLHPEMAGPGVLCGQPPAILSPAASLDRPLDERLASWRHELSHLARRDDLWRIGGEVLRTVWWWHPAVHWLLARREFEAELLADEAAVREGSPPLELARFLCGALAEATMARAPLGLRTGLFGLSSFAARIHHLRRLHETALPPDRMGHPMALALGLAAALALAGSMRLIAGPVAPTPGSESIMEAPEASSKMADDSKKPAAKPPTGGPVPQPPMPRTAPEAAPPSLPRSMMRSVKIRGQVVDDVTGRPIERVAWQGGSVDSTSKKTTWGFFYQPHDHLPEGRFERVIDFALNNRIRVLAPGYLPASILDEAPKSPTGEVISESSVTIRLRKGIEIQGVVLDHQGKPAAGAKVFFVPPMVRPNIVEGKPLGLHGETPEEATLVSSFDQTVAPVTTDAEGRFSTPAGAQGTLAVHTEAVDLAEFDLPKEGTLAEIRMPAPTTLVIDVELGWLDSLEKKGNQRFDAQSENPKYLEIHINNYGQGRKVGYQRRMRLMSPATDFKLPDRVRVAESSDSIYPGALADGSRQGGFRRRFIITGLPTGLTQIYRSRAGRMVDNRIDLPMRPGETVSIDWRRAPGRSVRGSATLPINTGFRKEEEDPVKPLDWSMPHSAHVTIKRKGSDTALEAATVHSDGRFLVTTHLPPGAYSASLAGFLPESRQSIEFTGFRLPDLTASTDFTVPALADPGAGPEPVEIELKVERVRVGDPRFVPTDGTGKPLSAAKGISLHGKLALPEGYWFFRRLPEDPNAKEPPKPDGRTPPIETHWGRSMLTLEPKHVTRSWVSLTANDGRMKSYRGRVNEKFEFIFPDRIEPGGYALNAGMVLAKDQGADREPGAELVAGTVLVRFTNERPVEDQPQTLTMFPSMFCERLKAMDPAKDPPRLRGRLTGPDGKPIVGARVRLFGGVATRFEIASTLTNRAGDYQFLNVRGSASGSGEAARCFIGMRVEHPTLVPDDGLGWRDLSFPNKLSHTETLNLKMTPGGYIEGTLTDPGKRSVANMGLKLRRLRPASGEEVPDFTAYVTTDPRGHFRSEPLPAGEFLLETNESWLMNVALGKAAAKPGETATIPLERMPIPPSISGQVLGPDHNSRKGAELYFADPTEDFRIENGKVRAGFVEGRAFGDEIGRFRIARTEANRKSPRLVAVHREHGYPTISREDVRDRMSIRLQPWPNAEKNLVIPAAAREPDITVTLRADDDILHLSAPGISLRAKEIRLRHAADEVEMVAFKSEVRIRQLRSDMPADRVQATEVRLTNGAMRALAPLTNPAVPLQANGAEGLMTIVVDGGFLRVASGEIERGETGVRIQGARMETVPRSPRPAP